MSFADEQKKLLRRKIDRLEIDMGFCDNIYGVSPCAASDSIKCYNTFFTCKDPANFAPITKTYAFINHDLPASTRAYYFPSKPLIKNVNDLPTEIKKDDTITRRLKIELYDEPDNDVGIDPYRASRNKIRGTFWKKFLARNPNYRNRIIRYYEGYEGLDKTDFEMRFIGRLENITIQKGFVVIEAVDLMKKLSETEYPLKTDISLAEDMPMMFEALTDTEMTGLNAFTYDFCLRRDFLPLNFVWVASESNTGGILTEGDYYYTVIAYDASGRAIAKRSIAHTLTSSYNSIRLAWEAVDGASSYRLYGRNEERKYLIGIITGGIIEFTDLGTIEADIGYIEPNYAERYFQLIGQDATDLGNWDSFTSDLTINVNDASDLTPPFWFKNDKEIIYCAAKSSDTLTGLKRGEYKSEIDRHTEGTNLFLYLSYAADNPFTILKDMLDNIGITSTYRTTKFDEYQAAWSGPNFGLLINTKDTKLNKLFFQLVNAVDCMCWQNEEGKVDILSHAEIPSSFTYLNDRANFMGSGSVDENDSSRYTDAVLYWNNFDPDKGIEERDGYNRINIGTDADARSDNEYGDEKYDVQYCVWLNVEFDLAAIIDAYVNSLLDKRRQRQRDAQALLTEGVEIKDSSLKVGQIVLVSTNEIQSIHGADLKDTAFRIIKKTPNRNKITIVFKRLYSATDTLKAETGADILNEDTNPLLTDLFI